MTSTAISRNGFVSTSLAIKAPCVCATTANITLQGEQTLDGVLTSGSRVLVKNQTAPAQNGIYITGTGNWTRDEDFDGTGDATQGTLVPVYGGTVNGATFWQLTTASPVIGSTSLAFSKYNPANGLGGAAAENLGNNIIDDGAGNLVVKPAGITLAMLAASALNNQYGGFLNKFRNPAHDIQQRGTSGTITAGAPAYTTDGWIVSCATANVTWSLSANTGGSGLQPAINGLKILGNAGVTDTYIKQRIESIIAAALASKTVTVQFAIYNSTGATFTPTLNVNYANAQDNFGAETNIINNQALSPCPNLAWTIVSYTFAYPANTVNGLDVLIDFGAALNGNTKFIVMTAADIRATPGATPGNATTFPVPEIRPVGIEYPNNIRYLPAFNSGSTLNSVAVGMCTTSSQGNSIYDFTTPARVPPTGISLSAASDFEVRQANGTLIALSALTLNQASNYSGEMQFMVGSTTALTAGNATTLLCKSAAGQILFTGAEL